MSFFSKFLVLSLAWILFTSSAAAEEPPFQNTIHIMNETSEAILAVSDMPPDDEMISVVNMWMPTGLLPGQIRLLRVNKEELTCRTDLWFVLETGVILLERDVDLCGGEILHIRIDPKRNIYARFIT
ncbi:MAG: hypothetical protein A2808_02445 [Candidatus Moranbacteria bacterium RIFCSPHIGHO2_01_FULL_55_24]|nr:MAG: hypothetical protein A2808_02445 [Candidatus Moranbacteria bacterium RIFCSPHIGHO2_01_FULL_55_24]